MTTSDDFVVESPSPVQAPAPTVAPVQTPTPNGGVPGTVRIHNRLPYPIDITLSDGTNVRLGVKAVGKVRHISEPIPKKLIPQVTRNLKGLVFEEVVR
jgi:hypothetical protein